MYGNTDVDTEGCQQRALRLANEAGHILLENGAEISRVEDTMERIATAYGVEEKSFFVLSNGIITTGRQYAKAEFIPIKGTQLSRVVDVNQLSRDVTSGGCTLDELESRLSRIRTSESKPWWERLTGITLGIAAFCIVFGGSFLDSFVSLFTGLFLGLFLVFASSHYSRIMSNIIGGLIGALLSIMAYHLMESLGIRLNIPNLIIGNIIALVPGVPFTNGIRDLANEDYLAGTTRLLDAFLVFFCIAVGVVLAFLIDNVIFDDMIDVGKAVNDMVTAKWYVQMIAAFIGTMGFSVLFGAPRKYYVICGLVGMLGWTAYIFSNSAMLASLVTAFASHIIAVITRCPVTVYLICGIIPLVPGGGLFWTLYRMLTGELRLAFETGTIALKVTIAIAAGIIIGSTIFDRLFKKHSLRHK